jgi:hypothetical protein
MTTTTTKATAAFNDDRNKLEILLERKIAIATDGLEEQFIRRLKHVTATKNIETICNYLIAMKAELNSSIMHKINRNKLQYMSEGTITTLSNSIIHIQSSGDVHAAATASSFAMTSFGILLTSSMSAGFTIGFIKG